MNSFAHALPFLDQHDYFAIGCALPDFLGAVDRRCRVRKNGAAKFLAAGDDNVAQLAGGIIQHIADDQWFHTSNTFSEMSMVFALELREILVDEPGFRPGFLGHIIIELLLDGFLHENNPGKLDRFYAIVWQCDSQVIENAVNKMAIRPTEKLSKYFSIFLREKYLYDYLDDAKLVYRVNQVLRRVKLKPVESNVVDWIRSARKRVNDSAAGLLRDYAMLVI